MEATPNPLFSHLRNLRSGEVAPKIALQGRIEKIEVLEGGRVVSCFDRPQKNLILNTGLDAIANEPIPDIFKVAVKGTGTTATVENPANTNTYSRSIGSATVTRTAGARDFTIADQGKLIKFDDAPKSEAIILTYNSATNVTVDRTSTTVITNKHITSIYAVDQTALATEYRNRTIASDFSISTVNMISAGSNFVAGDLGRTIFIPKPNGTNYDYYGAITAINSSSSATMDTFVIEDIAAQTGSIYLAGDHFNFNGTAPSPTSRTAIYSGVDGENGTTQYATTDTANRNKQILKRTFVFDAEISDGATVIAANVYSLATNGKVTRSSGARNFTSADLGYVISLDDGAGNVYEGKITNIDSMTIVSTTHTGDVAASLAATLYSFTTYKEIGFTDSDLPDADILIRVLLGTPVDVQAPTTLAPGQQLKVTYSMEETVGPSVSTAGLAPIYDPTAALSANKNGVYCVESLALATIDADGATLVDLAGLEPSVPGIMALSTDTAALAPLQNKIRIASLQSTELQLDDYTSPSNGDYHRTASGNFALNEAIGAWRSLFLYDESSTLALFTFLFTATQTKDGNHALNLTFKKTWDRNLAS